MPYGLKTPTRRTEPTASERIRNLCGCRQVIALSADVIQLEEYLVANQIVAGPSPVIRSTGVHERRLTKYQIPQAYCTARGGSRNFVT